MGSVCETFVGYVQASAAPDVHVCVVFDSYDRQTTKAPEQKRRHLKTGSYPDVVLEDSTPVPGNKQACLGNMVTKQHLIGMLSAHLEQAGVAVILAAEEGDADVVIVRKAIELGEHDDVVIIADDTDILVLLVYHAHSTHQFYMETKQHFIDIHAAQQALGVDVCRSLLFVHAMTGYDTTSAMFGVGKMNAFKVLQASDELSARVLVFGDLTTPKDVLFEVGEKFLSALYGGSDGSLDALRYHQFTSPKYVPLERMPPTSRACYYHCLRVHLQVVTWCALQSLLCPGEFGFKLENGALVPIITDKAQAPPEMLRKIRCSCKSTNRICTSCTCFKNRLPCSMYCKCGGQCENGGSFTTDGCE